MQPKKKQGVGQNKNFGKRAHHSCITPVAVPQQASEKHHLVAVPFELGSIFCQEARHSIFEANNGKF